MDFKFPGGDNQVNAKKKGDELLEALTFDHVERGKIQELAGYKDRRARQILVKLAQKDLLVSTGPRKPARLGFPLDVIERWLPRSSGDKFRGQYT